VREWADKHKTLVILSVGDLEELLRWEQKLRDAQNRLRIIHGAGFQKRNDRDRYPSRRRFVSVSQFAFALTNGKGDQGTR
jgi:hypothetical protein